MVQLYILLGSSLVGRNISFQDIPAKVPLCLVGPDEVTCHSESLTTPREKQVYNWSDLSSPPVKLGWIYITQIA